MPALLIVHHSPTRSMEELTERLVAGAHDPEVEGVDVVVRTALEATALEATAEDLLAADGYVLATPANFGYMSGSSRRWGRPPLRVQWAALRFGVAHVPGVDPGQQTSDRHERTLQGVLAIGGLSGLRGTRPDYSVRAMSQLRMPRRARHPYGVSPRGL